MNTPLSDDPTLAELEAHLQATEEYPDADGVVQVETNPNPMAIELRGYEVAKLTVMGWEVVAKYKPRESALNQALQSAAWLNERHPEEMYTVRPIISFLPAPLGELFPKDELHLDADFPEEVRSAAPSEHPNPVEAE